MLPFRSALVTGATGFIGQHLVRRLVAENVTTHCLVRAESLAAAARHRPKGAICHPLESDAPDDWQDALQGIEAEVVFHLASPGVVASSDSPELLIETNVRLIARLLTVVQGWPLRNIVHAGSFSEYAPSDAILTEDSPLVPATPYGASKVAAWAAGQTLAMQLGLPLVNVRLFHIYGPGEAKGRLIPYLYDRLARGELAQLTAGQQARDPIFIDDAIEALLAAACLPPAKSPIAYNVCSGQPVEVRQIGEVVADLMHAPPALLRWGDLPYRPGEMMRAVGDNHRFVQATGWQPRVGLVEGVARSLASLGLQRQVRAAG
jgi:GDP-4-dehydro-6-deoxy-D-mannose reductase